MRATFSSKPVSAEATAITNDSKRKTSTTWSTRRSSPIIEITLTPPAHRVQERPPRDRELVVAQLFDLRERVVVESVGATQPLQPFGALLVAFDSVNVGNAGAQRLGRPYSWWVPVAVSWAA
jgi:hypothetical protein